MTKTGKTNEPTKNTKEATSKTSETTEKKPIILTDKNAKKIADASDDIQVLAAENTGYVSQRLVNSQKHLYNIAYDVQRELNGYKRREGKSEKGGKSEKAIARKQRIKEALSKLQ